MLNKRIATPLLIIVITAILVGSFMPYPAKVFLGTHLRSARVPGTTLYFNLHRTLHVLVFAAMTWLLGTVVPEGGTWMRKTARFGLMAVTVFALAVFIEKVEVMAYHGPLEWADVRDDLYGVALAFAITLLTRLRTGTANPAASEK
jgi:hypothetical protein